MRGLVLSGGGARGSYQVGVLMALAEISDHLQIRSPFQIYTGVSAGAINAGFLAAGANHFSMASQKLSKLWSGLTSDQVFRSDALSIGKIGLSWMGDLSLGGLTGPHLGRSLLDTSPLGDLIRDNMEFHRIEENILNGSLSALAVTAMEYQTTNAVTFVQGVSSHPM